MPGGQVPLWVTYTLAVIAILGPIGGALLGSWLTATRDDKRWDRERQREDVRWQREQERLTIERRHEIQLHWREERSTQYSGVLIAMSEWLDALKTLMRAVRDTEKVFYGSGAERNSFEEATRRLKDRLFALDLAGSIELRKEARKLVDECRKHSDKARDLMFKEKVDTERAFDLVGRANAAFDIVRVDLIMYMRHDLSIDSEPTWDGSAIIGHLR